MRTDVGESVEYFEKIAEENGLYYTEDRDLDDYLKLSATCADDPDAAQPDRYHSLLKKYATQGALAGFQHGGPILISVDRDFVGES